MIRLFIPRGFKSSLSDFVLNVNIRVGTSKISHRSEGKSDISNSVSCLKRLFLEYDIPVL